MDIVIDLETRDPYLTTKGTDAHCRRWGGHVFMCGIYEPESNSVRQFPINMAGHALLCGLFKEGHTWYGANIKYDLNWLFSYGVIQPHHTHNTRFYDTHINEPLIDETQPPSSYHLDAMCRKYGYPTKPIEMLMDAAKQAGITCNERTVRGHLHKLPWDVVAEYNEHDLRATWHVIQAQQKLIREYKLETVQEMESKLIPVLSMMERQGVLVDIPAAEKLHDQIYVHIDETKAKLRQENNGNEVPLSASNALTEFLRDRGHRLPETPASTPERPRYSNSADTLLSLAHQDPVVGSIVIARKSEKIAKDFCKAALIETNHHNRIYPNINQMVSYKEGTTDDSKGVRFGRLSYSGPNLQQIPKRDTIGFDETGGLGSAMRALFVAEDGADFMSADFSSQEPRWIVHWAETWRIPGAEKAGNCYRNDPTTDYHSMVAEMAKVSRPMAKIINLGKGYEMGKDKLMRNLLAAGADPDTASDIITQYEVNFPHVSGASRAAMGAAEQLGYVRTFSGRRLHFNLWEATRRNSGPAMPHDQAYEKYVLAPNGRSSIKRAYCYRAFNRIVQGSSADQTKMAMNSLWYDHGILPTMQIHDELVDARCNREKALIYKNVMENIIQLTIPSLTEVKLGPNWKEGVLIHA